MCGTAFSIPLYAGLSLNRSQLGLDVHSISLLCLCLELMRLILLRYDMQRCFYLF